MPVDGPITNLVDDLFRATMDGGWIDLPSDTVPGFDWDLARRVARGVDARRLADGDDQIGFKLGWTSAPMREALGIEQPNWGTLWASQNRFEWGALRHPKLEPELVYRCGQTLFGPDVDGARVRAAAAGWALGLEVVHPRFESFQFTWLDNTADNSSCQAVIVGPFTTITDPAAVTIEFVASQTPGQVAGRLVGQVGEVREGQGSAAMGDPAEAVAWLVRNLHAEGVGLEPGQVVFTGGLAAPFDVEPGLTYRVTAPDLGPVVLQA